MIAVEPVAATLGTCRRGHPYSRAKTGGRVCLTCRTEAVRRWKRDNPGRVRAVAQAWRERNREKIAAAHAAWRAKHRVRLLAYWREQSRASRARRKAAQEIAS
jgi:hypothetical protein